MQWLQRFLAGRYGGDQLNNAILFLGVVLVLGLSFTGIPWLVLVAYVPLAVCLWRMFSRKTARRSYENAKFLKLWRPIPQFFRRTWARLKGSRQYKYFKCPQCGKALRAPRGKGKIAVTCRECGHQFITKV